MDQRPLRAGDSVDDYCPRERRVTSHAIVAVVDDIVRQTRCLTCDAEHEYKEAKMPRPRKKAPALYDQVLANTAGAPAAVTNGNVAADASFDASAEPEAPPVAAAADTDAEAPRDDRAGVEDLWVGHRPLIRATLPRTEGDAPPTPRPIPEFTMHQRHGRGGHGFRHGQGWGGNGNGNGPGGFRQGSGNGQGRGPQQPGQGGGRSRHRHRSKSRRSR